MVLIHTSGKVQVLQFQHLRGKVWQKVLGGGKGSFALSFQFIQIPGSQVGLEPPRLSCGGRLLVCVLLVFAQTGDGSRLHPCRVSLGDEVNEGDRKHPSPAWISFNVTDLKPAERKVANGAETLTF